METKDKDRQRRSGRFPIKENVVKYSFAFIVKFRIYIFKSGQIGFILKYATR